MYKFKCINRIIAQVLGISVIFASLILTAPVQSAEPVGTSSILEQTGSVISDAGVPFTLDRAPETFMSAGPSLFDNPLSISRIQSSHDTGSLIDNTLTVTFTVQNTLPPVNLPVIPDTATLTDTLNLLQAVDYENDPNTIHNVVLANHFIEAAAIIRSDPSADTDGESHVWNIGDIAPLGIETVTIRLALDSSNQFIALDSGMEAWGTLYGRSTTATTAPLRLVSSDFSQWLIWTMDADYRDRYMQTKLSEIGTTTEEIFTYIQSLNYEAYDGSLRGTRGTLWSEAGNSADLSSLMIAMLRANGIPARYRHGTLSETERVNVILSMFPNAGARGGVVAADAVTSNPASDPELLDTVVDHWWVEAYTEREGWVAYDPTVPDAEAGETFASDIEEPAAELPDAIRHKVNVRLRIEHYHPLNVTGPIPGLEVSYPLEYTIRTVDVIGQPIRLGHVVSSNTQGGLAYVSQHNRYSPYLIIGEEEKVVVGETYEDLLTNFPVGTALTTGSWLEFDVQFPDGTVEQYERELFDHIGYETRQSSGAHEVNLSGLGDKPSISEQSTYSFLLAPSKVSSDAINARFGEMVKAATNAQNAADSVESLIENSAVSDGDLAALRDAARQVTSAAQLGQTVHLLAYAAVSDLSTEQLGNTAMVKGYYDAPRILTLSWDGSANGENVAVQFDLRRNNIKAIAYPGQTWTGLQAFNFSRGLYDASIEGILMERFSGRQVKSVHHVFQEVTRFNIPLEIITAMNIDDLTGLAISDEAKSRIVATLQDPLQMVIVPAQMVILNNEETIGWYQIDMLNGRTIDTMENGQHVAAIEYAGLLIGGGQESAFAVIGFFQGFTAYTLSFLGEIMERMPFTTVDIKTAWQESSKSAEKSVVEIAEKIGLAIDIIGGCFNIPDPLKVPGWWVGAYLNGVGFGGEVAIDTGAFLDVIDDLDDSINLPTPLLCVDGMLLNDKYKKHLNKDIPGGVASIKGQILPEDIDDWKLELKVEIGGFVRGANFAKTIIDNKVDPPIPTAYYSRSVIDFSEEVVVWTNGTFPATLSDNGLNLTVSSENLFITGNNALTYQTNGKNRVAYEQLNVAAALSVVGNGALVLDTSGSLTNDNAISVETQTENSSHSYYAPAVTGMAHGAEWKSYASTITPMSESTFTIDNVRGTFAGNELYEDEIQITTTDAISLSGSGTTHSANFATEVSASLMNAGVILGPSASYANGLGAWNMTGTVNVSDNSDVDTVKLATTSSFFTLDVSPASSTIQPLQTATFQGTIAGNINADYRLFLFLPGGWRGELSPTGRIDVTPPLSTAPGDYQIRFVAQVVDQPDVMLMSEQIVTITQLDGVKTEITPDPYHTVPWGEAQSNDSLENNGQVQLPNSAYNISVHNTSSIPRQFTVALSGVNSDWIIFDGNYGDTEATIFLESNEIGIFGLYVEPPTDPLPQSGTMFPINVNVSAVDNRSVAANHSTDFVMPAVAYGYMKSIPEFQYVAAGDSTQINLSLENVGNAAGTFAVTTTVATLGNTDTLTVDSPVTQIEVAQSQTISTPIAIDTTNTEIGERYYVQSVLKNGPYRPATTAVLEIVSSQTGCFYAAAAVTSSYNELLTAGLVQLGDDINRLVISPSNPDALADVYASFDTLFSLLPQQVNKQALIQARDALPASLNTICAALEPVTERLAIISETAFSAQLTPGSYTALQGEMVIYELELTNQTDNEVSYEVTKSVLTETEQQLVTIPAQQSVQIEIPIVAEQLSMGAISADIVALENGTPITYTAVQRTAALNVVDSLLQVVAVTANPTFVEGGTSSTSLSVEVLNAANRQIPATVVMEIVDTSGVITYSESFDHVVTTNNSRDYDLTTVDTSGWQNGNYDIYVNILDENGQPIPDGTGRGNLVVGAALEAQHKALPSVVAPGTATVTTIISTTINSQEVVEATQKRRGSDNSRRSIEWIPSEASAETEVDLDEVENVEANSELSQNTPDVEDTESTQGTQSASELPATQLTMADAVQQPFFEAQRISNTSGVIRYEENHPDILYNGLSITNTTGGWNILNWNGASNGAYARSDTISDTIQLTFESQWINIGLLAGPNGGFAEITLDGISQGDFDLYAHDDTAKEIVFDNLTEGIHAIEIKVLDKQNPYTNRNRVYLDYIDIWDGTALPDGHYVETDARIVRSADWSVRDFDGAKDGAYLRLGNRAWFPFTGDSVSFHTLAYSGGGEMEIFVDGESQGKFSVFSQETISRTYSFDGLGAGPHIMLVNSYRGAASVDGFSTPGAAPFVESATPTGIVRYEEDHPDLRYNDLPFSQTSTSWSMYGWNAVSDGYYARSVTISDTVSLAFQGSWVNVGLFAGKNGGIAEIFLDGVSQGEVDLYSSYDRPYEITFENLSDGLHTIKLMVMGKRNPLSATDRVYLDYIDVWDGSTIADGDFSEIDERVVRSPDWDIRTSEDARDGAYMRLGNRAWFPFTGDSVSFHTRKYERGGDVELYIDGESVGIYSLDNTKTISHTLSFNTLGSGPHIMTVAAQNGQIAVDGFETPGVAPFIPNRGVKFGTEIDSVVGGKGETQTYPLELQNVGAKADTYTLTAQGQWLTELSTFTITLQPNQSVTILVSYILPLTASTGATDSIVIGATSNSDETVSASSKINIYNVKPTTQLCIALDASGSISAENFDLMKQGLADAFGDDTALPLDGSIEVSIIQFSSNTTIELMPTVVLDKAVANRIVNTTLRIDKDGGGTATHLAIDTCADLLQQSSQFAVTGERVINLVTDGAANDPDATVTSRDTAVASGITQLNVEAIAMQENGVAFIRDELVWPQPGYEAPPFQPDSGGFVIPIESFEDFAEAIRQKVGIIANVGFSVEMTHTVDLPLATPLADTITPQADRIIPNAAYQDIYWTYNLSHITPDRKNQFDSTLSDLTPGEARQISEGTLISYNYSGGSNRLRLPPLFIVAEHIVGLNPAIQTSNSSSTVSYKLILNNPAATADNYTIEVLGLPSGWISLPQQVAIEGGSTLTETLKVQTPSDADLTSYTFAVRVTNQTGGQDQVEGRLTIVDAFELTVEPELIAAQSAQPITYTIAITNLQPTNRTYTLTITGIASQLVSHPTTVDVPANSSVRSPLYLVAPAKQGAHFFDVKAETDQIQATAMAGVTVQDQRSIDVSLRPAVQTTGRGIPAIFTIAITNTGSIADTYDLQALVPTGWSATFDVNGVPITELSLSPYLFNSAEITLIVIPPIDSTPNDYNFTVVAQSQQHPTAQAAIDGVVTILDQGITVELTPKVHTVLPNERASWDVNVTNRGTVADTFVLTGTGILAGLAEFSSNTLTLAPNQSGTVRLTATDFSEVAMKRYLVGVAAQSKTEAKIRAVDTGQLFFSPYENVEVSWGPQGQTITGTMSANFLLSIKNTGNVPMNYDINLVSDTLQATAELDQIYILPKTTSVILVKIVASQFGLHEIEGVSVSETGASRDSDRTTLNVLVNTSPMALPLEAEPSSLNRAFYLPIYAQVLPCTARENCYDAISPTSFNDASISHRNTRDQFSYLPLFFK